MATLISSPTNTNYLQATRFVLSFPRIINTQYFCQEVNLPGVSLQELPQNTPFVDLYRPGNKISYELLNVSFIVDEELKSWMEIHDWIKGMTFPENFDQYNNLRNLSPAAINSPQPQYSDGVLQILSNLNNLKMSIKFHDMFPVKLSDIQFNTTDENTTTITATASFRFSYYDVERV